MNTHFFLELIGYTGSLLVIISMLMTSVIKLRVINTIGSVIFCGYALCIHSYPTAAMQVCLIVINVINLAKLNNTKKEYSAVQVKADDGFLKHFLTTNAQDIKKYFLEFSTPADTDQIYLITCAGIPAGVFITEKNDHLQPGTPALLIIKLDYTTPAYRDCSAGKFILSKLAAQGIKMVQTQTQNSAHQKYLKKLGFEQNINSQDAAKNFDAQNAATFTKLL